MTLRRTLTALSLLLPLSAFPQSEPPHTQPAQSEPAPPPDKPSTHDITKVDQVPTGGTIAVPFPDRGRRRMKRYEVPELSGARQALGSQLIDGELPAPLLDYIVRNAGVEQRISLFQGALVVIRMTAGETSIQKRVIIPEDALARYLEKASPAKLEAIAPASLTPPNENGRALLRIYKDRDHFVERTFEPTGRRPHELQEQINPLEDLLRTMSEDRTVTSTVANYEPQVGDELVGDDGKGYRVERIVAGQDIVQLRCLDQPTLIYVPKKDLYNYFVGRK